MFILVVFSMQLVGLCSRNNFHGQDRENIGYTLPLGREFFLSLQRTNADICNVFYLGMRHINPHCL